MNREITAEMAVQKVTQKDLADTIGIHAATMNRKLKDPGQFTVGEFLSVLDHLGVDLNKQTK